MILILERVKALSYQQRMSMLIVLDSIVVFTSIFFCMILLSASFSVLHLPVIISSISLLISHHLFAVKFKLYKRAWEYASIRELVSILKAVTFSVSTVALLQYLLLQDIYFRLLVLTWMLHVMLIGGSRFVWRMLRDRYTCESDSKKRTLIIGAGSAGTMVARQLLHNQDAEQIPVAFIDDDVNKQKLDILGLPVVGGIDCIAEATEDYRIDHIVIAIPSLSRRELNVIHRECARTKAKTLILPMLEDIVTGKVSVNQFRDVQVEDLLGRDPVELDMKSISEYITNKVVLVTGAGGSIGSEICRQIIQFDPQTLVLLGHGENSIYVIEMELKELLKHRHIKIETEIADLQDKHRMAQVMSHYRPHVVYHAAAHKHVPLMEQNPEEAIKNNVIGTYNVANAASDYGVQTFVMISTDKAVNPTSVMGASKKMAEMLIQHKDSISSTKFVTVRFGNVLGSRGSVIPLFKKQIEQGGPVTVTHPDMIRYFMTIPEASRLVLQAGTLAKGGEIFVLDMGEPVRIVDLAKNLIKLSGHTEDEIEIQFTGIRPGEKLFEELLNEDEVKEQQVYPNIYIGKKSALLIKEIEHLMKHYRKLDKEDLRKCMLDIANYRRHSYELIPITG